LSSHAKKIPEAISVAEKGNQNDGERRNLFTVSSLAYGSSFFAQHSSPFPIMGKGLGDREKLSSQTFHVTTKIAALSFDYHIRQVCFWRNPRTLCRTLPLHSRILRDSSGTGRFPRTQSEGSARRPDCIPGRVRGDQLSLPAKGNAEPYSSVPIIPSSALPDNKKCPLVWNQISCRTIVTTHTELPFPPRGKGMGDR